MKKTVGLMILLLLLAGCVVDEAIRRYNTAADRVQLGDPKERVLSLLMPTQEGLSARDRKRPEQYIKDNIRVEIYYFRSLHQPDTLITDDEFTPYVFEDGKLTAIGWRTLGGPKTQGQTTPETYIDVQPTVY